MSDPFTSDADESALGRTYRPAVSPTELRFPGFTPHPGFGYRWEEHPDMIIERDVAVPVRGGLTLYADVFRPKNAENVPVIIGYAPFGKHPHIPIAEAYAGCDIPFETLSEYVPWEQLDPVRWTKDGYALAFVDAKGNWYSEGDATFFTPEEAWVGHDVVEWFGEQPWSNGKVGWGGVSYYAMTAWSVAATQPPHLAAILAWDAASDVYREAYMKAGIPALPFIHGWMQLTQTGTGKIEDMEAGMRDHPMFDDFWKCRVADWSQVTVPTYAVSEFTNDLHLRGTIEAWTSISSVDKFLELRGDKEWQGFYDPESVNRQKAFFDTFLLGQNNDVESWPRVRRALRTHHDEWTFLEDDQWPPANVTYRSLWVDAGSASLTPERPVNESTVKYLSTDVSQSAHFDITFAERTEVAGEAKLRLWVSTDGSNDADLFVGVEKLDRAGQRVPFTFSQMYNDGPLGFGWLRVSHRRLDESKSTPQRPVHLHDRPEWLTDGEIVPVDIEIWPNSVLFDEGETLRVIVKGSSISHYGGKFEIVFGPLNNSGNHVIYSGGAFDSFLLLPVVEA